MDKIEAVPQLVRLEDYRVPAWRVPEISLIFDLDPAKTRVKARLVVERNAPGDAPLRLDGDELRLISVSVDGQTLGAGDYELMSDSLTLRIDADSAVVETEVEIAPAANTKLMGLYASGGKLCTQCEAEGFRRITYFPDRPDILSRYMVTLRADRTQFPVLLSNGNPVERGDLGSGRHFVRWEDPFPKPCYLFALVAGDLKPLADHFVTASGRRVDLAIWVEEADVPRCHHAMDALKKAMAWDERVYGREYDLDQFNIVAVSDFNFGAMENKGLNIFNSKYIIADAETATDADFDAVAAVVAHEYFHNWTGNRITCRDWFQLSLKEGLTVYRDQEFSADHGSRAVKRIDDVRMLRAGQFPEDAGPLAHAVLPDSYIEISNFYTATIYNKGAEVIRMAATLLGPDRYRAATDLYFQRHDGQAVTVEDWVKALEDASGLDLGQFRLWYQQAGTPHVKASWTQDLASGRFTLTLDQSLAPTPGQERKLAMHIPLKVSLIGAQSGRALAPEQLVELRNASTEILFEGIDEPAVPSLNRGFTAPVIVDAPYERASLAHLSRADNDPFARYEAMQRLALLTINDRLDGKASPGDSAPLIDAIAATLSDPALDPAFVADAILLPSEAIIGEQRPRVDVEAIHDVREGLRRAILAALHEQLWAVFHAHPVGRYDASAEARARRRLRNVVLGLLMADDDSAATAAADAQYHAADNMTDRIGALSLLASSQASVRAAALADFHARFRHDPLVIDKWFTIQALSLRPDTLAAVEALSRHPDFTLSNPNRARSLIGAFGMNQRRFHEAGGAGYRFLADQVLKLDALNPQTAARMVTPLGRWKRYDEGRGAMMRAELQRIMAHAGLSKDVFEMVSKSLI